MDDENACCPRVARGEVRYCPCRRWAASAAPGAGERQAGSVNMVSNFAQIAVGRIGRYIKNDWSVIGGGRRPVECPGIARAHRGNLRATQSVFNILERCSGSAGGTG